MASQIRVAAARRECSCRTHPLPRPISATCRASRVRNHPRHRNAVRDWERCYFRAQITIAITIRSNKACILLLICPFEVLGAFFPYTFVVMRVVMQTSAVCFMFPITMEVMHDQPRRSWPQYVPYSHLTGVDTEGGAVGPLRFWALCLLTD